MEAESFILSTDFATLKNDASGTTSVSVPGSQAVAASIGSAGSYIEYHSDITIGTQGAITRVQISSSKDSDTVYSSRIADHARTGDTPSGPGVSTYTVDAFVYRLNATTVRCQAYIMNPYPEILTTEAGAETFTFYVNTFIPPYA